VFTRVFAIRAAAAMGLIAALGAPAAAQEAAAREGRVYVSVTDKDGKVLPLAPAEVTISEDGRKREVLRVEKASGPVQIALLVDDSQAIQSGANDVRNALKQFIAKVLDASPDTQIALISYGERPVLLTDYTNSRVMLERGISRIFARQGAGAYMLEAIVSAARGIVKRDPARSHIVVVGTDGVEFSNDHYERVLDQIAESGATLWALTLTDGPRASDSEEVRNRAMVLGRGTKESGGRHDQVLANSAAPLILGKVADTILNHYVVVYGRPDALVPPKKIDVDVRKPGAKVLAPSFAPRVRK